MQLCMASERKFLAIGYLIKILWVLKTFKKLKLLVQNFVKLWSPRDFHEHATNVKRGPIISPCDCI